MELKKRRNGERFDARERRRKKAARENRVISKKARRLRGIKAKIFNKKRFKEKIVMKKLIKAHEEKDVDVKDVKAPKGAIPAYLLDREKT